MQLNKMKDHTYPQKAIINIEKNVISINGSFYGESKTKWHAN